MLSFDAAHQMDLDPFAFANQCGVFVLRVHPLKEAAGGKARRVNREIRLNSLQRQAAFFDQHLEVGSQHFVFEVARNRIVVSGLRKIALALSVPQVRHKAPSRHGRVDLERAREDHVLKRQSGATHFLRWTTDTLAQLGKQSLKLILFVSLRFVVRGPFLLVGFSDGRGFGEGLCFAIIGEFPPGNNLNRVNVVAARLSGFKIGTGALRAGRVGYDRISASGMACALRLRWHEPAIF